MHILDGDWKRTYFKSKYYCLYVFGAPFGDFKVAIATLVALPHNWEEDPISPCLSPSPLWLPLRPSAGQSCKPLKYEIYRQDDDDISNSLTRHMRNAIDKA
jgi:hypothetical protein